MPRWSVLRGVLLFFAGLLGEVVLTVAWLNGQEPNQSLMLLFATMMGLPVFLQRDEDKREERREDPPPPRPDRRPARDDERLRPRRGEDW